MKLNKLRTAERILENERASYLKRRGWVYTRDNPGDVWLWQKALPDGRIVLVGKITAVEMQAKADAISINLWPRPPK